jgi:hypothetical protein
MHDVAVEVLWDNNGDPTHSIGWLTEAKNRCLQLVTEYSSSGFVELQIPVESVINLKLI